MGRLDRAVGKVIARVTTAECLLLSMCNERRTAAVTSIACNATPLFIVK
jgi:hypothetical protein